LVVNLLLLRLLLLRLLLLRLLLLRLLLLHRLQLMPCLISVSRSRVLCLRILECLLLPFLTHLRETHRLAMLLIKASLLLARR
jgi:hypothetical protein